MNRVLGRTNNCKKVEKITRLLSVCVCACVRGCLGGIGCGCMCMWMSVCMCGFGHVCVCFRAWAGVGVGGGVCVCVRGCVWLRLDVFVFVMMIG